YTANNTTYFQSVAEAIYAEHSISGWKTSLDIPEIEWPKPDDTYYYTGKPFCSACGSGLAQFRVKRMYVHMPDGSTHELRAGDQPFQGASIQKTGTFYAVDGSRLRYDGSGVDSSDNSIGTLYLSDGTRY